MTLAGHGTNDVTDEPEGLHQGPKAAALRDFVASLDPQLAEWGRVVVTDGVWKRDGLSREERLLVAVAALAVSGHEGHLRNYLHTALHAGVPASKLHETILMMVVYGGWPTVTTALTVWQEVVRSARRQGLTIDIEYPQ
jgi:alkylhydroperoxidase/carboxymuconolactone decarboxylase family protein YurZ